MGKYSRKYLSDEEISFIDANWDSMTVAEIALSISWNPNTLRQKIRERYGKGKTTKRVCAVCGKEFITRYRAYYCGEACSLKKDAAVAKTQRVLPEKRYSSYISGAKTRGYEFSLTFEEFMIYWQRDCVYCGDPIDTIGLDRVDNTIGYTISNVVPCCTTCNKMKSAQTTEDFLEHISKIAGRQM